MNLRKCDRCKKIIRGKFIDNGLSLSSFSAGISVDLCTRCAPPLLRFLKKYAKIQEKSGR